MATWRAAPLVALLALAGTAPAALAAQGNVTLVAPPHFRAVSDDGSKVFLETGAALVAQDTDSEADVYELDAGTPELLSIGPAGGNAAFRPATFEGAAADGARVFFTTREALVAADSDSTRDIYEHSGGQTKLLTPAESTFHAVTPDGKHVFFSTDESLVAEDSDATADVYQHVGGAPRLVSVGPGGANVVDASFAGTSVDGSRVWFSTRDALVPQDDDGSGIDVYERAGGATTLVTNWPASGGGGSAAAFLGASEDDSRVFIGTAGAVTPDDTDATTDIFEVSSAATTLVSTGPADAPGGGPSQLIDVSSDGARVYFSSPEVLVTGRPAGVFERAGGVTTWLGATVSSLEVSGDGGTTYFVTPDALVPADTDGAADVYARTAAGTTLVSAGFAADAPRVTAVSENGARLFFTTTTPLEAADADFTEDLYALWNDALYVMSSGPTSWPAAPPSLTTAGITPDGGQVFFETFDRLLPVDGDSELDLYEARFPDTAGYARPKGASPLRVPLVPAFEECTTPNSTHGPPLESGSCAPPIRTPGRLTVGTPDSNGEAAESVGHVRLSTLTGNPGTSVDDADVRIELQDTDVREASNLADYAGELELAMHVRITDRDGLEPPLAPVTEEDAELSVAVSCAPTASPAVGSTCGVDTTADAVIPGVALEGRRTIWAHGAVHVFDGGADGEAETLGDNDLFQTQGLFVP
jgi:hypothetical protein